MKFWDSSALVPILVAESRSTEMRALARADPEIVVWWATWVECASAIARRERAEPNRTQQVLDALDLLDDLIRSWIEVPPSDRLRDVARRIVRVHDVRAADAFQLAAARAASEEEAESLAFVTLDERVALAASREGFPVLP